MSIRVPVETVKATVKKAFLNLGLTEAQAEQCAEIHTESSLEGIESHGLNRVPRFAEYVQKGWVDIKAKPELVGAKGAVENYDGHLGIGTLNATFCMDRAVELAKVHGIGCVALTDELTAFQNHTAAIPAKQRAILPQKTGASSRSFILPVLPRARWTFFCPASIPCRIR